MIQLETNGETERNRRHHPVRDKYRVMEKQG